MKGAKLGISQVAWEATAPEQEPEIMWNQWVMV